MRDINYDELNPRIRKTVEWLRNAGFETTDSGDGVTNAENGMEGTLPIPHVHIRVAPEKVVEEARRLLQFVKDAGINLNPTVGDWHAWVETVYVPIQHIAIVTLYNVLDENLMQA